MRSRLDVHDRALTKSVNELSITDNGEQSGTYGTMWAVLVDMGYYGINEHIRGIHPKRRPAGGYLEADDLERNQRISSDRVLVENFFGRVCLLWKIAYSTFCWGHEMFSDIQRITFALTNFHVSMMPLRAADGTHYRSVLARYERMSYEMTERKRQQQLRARRRRLERMALSRGRTASSRSFLTPPSSQL
ncbi:hypothetical protein H257_19579 [Aphanomyces astaci]|uniref:DDE Tnp4 domain-containing protein n=1 Tax=Aphanomyces astaci TaxID=112090 RepID=W4F9I5_APHAT|nr:hypothetical protein H257_19579 [Aphanomyces astaci]ETV63501.1 hypothetical protein H257_19579 [Aphanomyces astaci]|eukprot:XP_009847015.1 hypothetical protein H257_19579 [Aphanomyces astaci]